MALVDANRIVLKAVEDAKVDATVKDKGGVNVAVEWATGTGPQALRSVCTCGATGICEHVVATLETVRTTSAAPIPAVAGGVPEDDIDYSWLPEMDGRDTQRQRARSIWPVISTSDGKTLTGALYLDTPRLRGVIRDAESILSMMESTPPDDWDDVDRDLIRDEAVQEAFGPRISQRALARAFFRLTRHPRLRYDERPGENRHPAELAPFSVDLRGLRLRASRHGQRFIPTFERADGSRFSPAKSLVLDGPPMWVVSDRVAYLLDGTFEPRKAIVAADAVPAENGSVKPPSTNAIARVAAFLTPTDRAELGVVDASKPALVARMAWRDGALLARLGFVDRETGARAPFSAHGGIAPIDGRFVRFASATARTFAQRFVEAGFVPRGGDGFALHDAERAAVLIREILPEWEDVEVRLDESLSALSGGADAIDISVSARPSSVEGESNDWFELNVDVFVGGGDALTPKELAALLSSSGRYAEVRGKLFDVAKLRSQSNLLSDITDRKRNGLAALVALRDELHESFGNVTLPEEVERLRDKLRDFQGIEEVEPPSTVADTLRGYQKRGLDFLAYLSSFQFGGILADEMGLGKALTLDTLILTPRGWVENADIRVGDEVINAQGTTSRVTGVYPQGFKEAFKVTFSDGASTICCDEHLWAVNSPLRKSRGNPYRVLPLSEIRKHLVDAAGNARHFIPIVEPVTFAPLGKPLPMDPYVLGALIGDGGFTANNISLTTADDYIAQTCAELLPTGTEMVARGTYGFHVRQAAGAGFRNSAVTILRDLGLWQHGSHEKFIPHTYKFASIDERIALLQGLMDTDGSVTRIDNHLEYTTTSRKLMHDVMFLVQSLGGTVRVNAKISTNAFPLTVALPNGIMPFRLPRKAETYRGRVKYPPARAIRTVESVGLKGMQCIAVDSPDHLFVIDEFVVTHNTLQVVTYLLRRKQLEGAAPSLVIAPTSVTHTWESEIRRFAPELTTLRLQSGSDRAARFEEIENHDVVITSYALARLDAAQLERFNFRTLILDEAQNAKNPSSQIAKVVRNLRADHRLALTGTPVENSLRDLWAIFAFVEPGLLGSEASFRRRFENPIGEGDERAAKALRSRLEPFVLRRTKEDVARELPERTEQVIECELSPLQRRLYRGIAEAARRDVLAKLDEEGGMEGASVHVLAALTRLRQVCAHPGLIVPSYIDEPEASGKFDAFIETVEEVLSGGHRVLVFSAFASMLKIMRAALDKRNVNYGYLDGSTKDRDRQAEVERFMTPDGPPVFLCSLKAGGVGLTLTAADYVILYDPWWNPAVERQAIDRTHRIGQTRPVTAYRMVTAGSVEEKIRALAERKSALSRAVIKADSAVAKTLTREDLEMLFADPE
ncbi:MAG: hypothetical protein NVSMB5_07400 [Candidatus Velthaea sp.]